ncbi:MAG: trehalose-6-phosphate synthase [Candidatus Sulfotelmatobacter sp.]|jgi:alpha,alpha-trehalose-phosphate synthase [UDP-forming]
MRLLSLRLIISLIIGITLVSLAFSYYQVLREKRTLRSDLEHRAEVVGESLAENVEKTLETGSASGLQRLVNSYGNREHLLGVAVYDRKGAPLAISSSLGQILQATPYQVTEAMAANREQSLFLTLDKDRVHMFALPLHWDDETIGGLVVVHNVEYIRAQNLRTWRQAFLSILVQVVLIALITLLIVRWSIAGPIARAAQWMRALRMGRISSPQQMPDLDLFKPLAWEVVTFAESLNQARSAAENEARLREAGESSWTADRLAVQIQSRLDGSRLFVVSNREPYIHQRDGKSIKVNVPASGLVTALEPVLNACDGTWIAHGSGDADTEVVDSHDRLPVPPNDPRYTLRRVWLSKEEEEGYYYGFSNEGLWPLCHIAHTRPIFRERDFQLYEEVNRKFANAVLEEIAGTKKPIVLVQDYHFALLPRFIKEKRPDARVAIFWHIPWPNPESFGICPWQRQLVDGLLGADLVGFHIQSHCNNFLQTVDRVVESRIDGEHFAVLRQNHRTIVRPFPISVKLTDDEFIETEQYRIDYQERSALLHSLGVESSYLGVGVDRVDYTKGIHERFRAIELFLEKYPRYQGLFTFVQIGAPSRTHIKRYHDLLAELEAEAERINWRFQAGNWKPILFLKRQHSHEEIEAYYRAADLCLVTSLHDGMNLVAKEFVAARKDERGVLILSQFTGAARELRDALLVNPYDIDKTAEAIRAALEMEPEEKQMRIHRMRKVIRENNIYHWAGNLVTELCELRLDIGEKSKPPVRESPTAA